MEKLLEQIQQNAAFVLITALIIVAVAVFARLVERKLPTAPTPA